MGKNNLAAVHKVFENDSKHITKFVQFFSPVMTTGFDRKKYSLKNFSLEGRGIRSHVPPMLTGPELGSCLRSSRFGTRYKFFKILLLNRPAGDKLPSCCLKSHSFH